MSICTYIHHQTFHKPLIDFLINRLSHQLTFSLIDFLINQLSLHLYNPLSHQSILFIFSPTRDFSSCLHLFIFLFQEDHTDSSSCDSDRTEHCYSRHVSSSSHVSGKQVTDLHQILSPDDPADEGHHSQRIVPVYWSASQLLSKLDQRQQGQSQNLPSHRNYQNQSSYQQNHLNYPHNMNDNYQYDDSRYVCIL